MKFHNDEIGSEYSRWLQIVGSDDPYESDSTVGLQTVLKAHFLIADYFSGGERGVGGVGPKSLPLLHSAIYRQFVSFAGREKWPDHYHKLATLIFGLVKDHAFHDANKRTSFLVAIYQLERLGRTPRVHYKVIEDFIVDIAKDDLEKFPRFVNLKTKSSDPEVHFIADFLKRNTREIDKRTYVITYAELNSILKGYGFELRNPKGNYIDIVKEEERRKYPLGIGPKVKFQTKLDQIGFPGWKEEVGKGALKTVRETTGLTAKNGIDSKVFFQGADSLASLVLVYSEPLKNLADR